jgi:hypothetical protein
MSTVVFKIVDRATGEVIRVTQKEITVLPTQDIEIIFHSEDKQDAINFMGNFKLNNGLQVGKWCETAKPEVTIDERHPVTKVRRRLATLV